MDLGKTLAAAAVSIGLLGGAAGPASAAPPSPGGAVTGTAAFEFGCDFVFQKFDLMVEGKANRGGTLELGGCVTLGTVFIYDADFTFTARNGATITGQAIGSIANFDGALLDLTLEVVDATKQFKKLVGSEFILVAEGEMFGPVTGTLMPA